MHLRRCSYATLLGLMASCIAAAIAGAQGWPQRFVTLVVPFGAGSGTDVVARIFAARRSEVLGKQVVVENIAGGGGTLGAAWVAKAAPDGYQLVIGAVDTFAQSQYLFKTPPYNAVRDSSPWRSPSSSPLC
jgi:tripartite-type tricarboxylate transporter receptor subunit TctC